MQAPSRLKALASCLRRNAAARWVVLAPHTLTAVATGAKGGDRCKPLLFQVGTTGPYPSGSDGCPALIDPSTCRNASRSQRRTDGSNRGGISRLVGGTPTSRLEAAGSHKWLETGDTPLFCPRSGVPGEKREYNKTVNSTNTRGGTLPPLRTVVHERLNHTGLHQLDTGQ